MEHVVKIPAPPFTALNGAIEVHQVPVWTDNLCWIFVCTQTGEAAVVDGPQADEVLTYVEQHGIRLTTILNTHTHGDHIGLNLDLQRRGRLDEYRVVGPASTATPVPGLTEPVAEGDVVKIGAVEGQVMLTEGHLNGHVSYLFGDVLFCGDTLFTGGCGYLFDGPPAKMFQSLMRLAQLPGDTRVCCAHEYTEDNLRFAWFVEPNNDALAERIRDVWTRRARGECTVPSTIALEQATNPFLRPGSPMILQRLIEESGPQLDGDWTAIFTATRQLKNDKTYRERGDEALPL